MLTLTQWQHSKVYDHSKAWIGAFLQWALPTATDPQKNQIKTILGADSFVGTPVVNHIIPRWWYFTRGEDVIICIEGTTTFDQWVSHVVNAGYMEVAHCDGFSATYFETVAESIYLAIQGVVKTTSNVMISGHSLGGAVAKLIAKKFHKTGRPKVSCYTYGCPKSATEEFDAEDYFWCFDFRDEFDVVPAIPFDRMMAAAGVILDADQKELINVGISVYVRRSRRFVSIWDFIIPFGFVNWFAQLPEWVVTSHYAQSYFLRLVRMTGGVSVQSELGQFENYAKDTGVLALLEAE